MVELENVIVTYASGVHALKIINVTFCPSQFTVLLGPSGAGKSTLLRCLNGRVKPTSCNVTTRGEDIANHHILQLNGFDAALPYSETNRLAPNEERHFAIHFTAFDRLIEESDYRVLALPLTERTVRLTNAETLTRMPKRSYLINPARGALVDEKAIADVLQSG